MPACLGHRGFFIDDCVDLSGSIHRDHLHARPRGLFWDRTVTRWWHVQAGLRHDFGEGPSRTWAAVGVQGLAPYWVEATAYVGDDGRTAVSTFGRLAVAPTVSWGPTPSGSAGRRPRARFAWAVVADT